MKKILFLVTLACIYIAVGMGNEARAALVTVDPHWNIKVNVLAYSSDQEYELTNIANNLARAKNSRLSLVKNGETVEVKLNGEDVEWDSEFNVTSEEIVEIERSRQPDNIKIYSTNEGFNIEQTGYLVKTDLPIVIDSKNKSLALETNKGTAYLVFLPKDVVQTLKLSGTISEVSENDIKLAQDEEGVLYYQVDGNRIINLFKIVELNVTVSAKLDAGTGRVMDVAQPIWLSLFGFMLS